LVTSHAWACGTEILCVRGESFGNFMSWKISTYVFVNDLFQNCTEFVLDVLNAAVYETDDMAEQKIDFH
jgi:hypothetical protein